MSITNALYRDLDSLVKYIEKEQETSVNADPYRLKFHLMPPVGWMNDPNGLCFCEGYYHVFYQYSPFNPRGGVKLWGHYRSSNLTEWEKLPVMLYPDRPWDIHGVYSGSALVEEGKIYLYYTGNVKHEGKFDYINEGRGSNTALAVSEDKITVKSNRLLMENKDYPKGLTCHVRDPKVWSMEGKYYMVQGARTSEDRGVILVFESEDKYNWKHINILKTPEKFGYMWECPDLFELKGQWFLLCSPQGVKKQGNRFQNIYSCGYFPLYGDFRKEYTLGEYEEIDCGFDFYAPQSFSDGGRRLLLGWMGMPDADYTNPTVKYGWQHCMSTLCELKNVEGKLFRMPVVEVDKLHGKNIPPKHAKVFDLLCTVTKKGRITIRGCAVIEWNEGDIKLTISERKKEDEGDKEKEKDGKNGEGNKDGEDNKNGNGLYTGRTVRRAEAVRVNELRILADTSSIEIFINEGERVMSTRYYPLDDICGVVLEGIRDYTLWDMKGFELKRQHGENCI